MKMQFLVPGLSCVFLLLSGHSIHALQEGKQAEVEVARPLVREVNDFEEFAGRTEAREKVEVRARVSGYLSKTIFKEGDLVKQGDFLFEIDSRTYQAQLAQAKANLRIAQVQLELAGKELNRAGLLLKEGVIAREEHEQSMQKKAEAEASLKLAETKHDTAKLDLDFTRITSAINGRAGRYLVTVGNLVEAHKTILTTVVSLDPMYVYFDADERSFLRMKELLASKASSEKEPQLPIQVRFSAEPGVAHVGNLQCIDSRVNPDTGSIICRVVIPNKKGMLLPGMAARVRVPVGLPYKALLVDERAVSGIAESKGKKLIHVVNSKNIVESRTVEARFQDGLWIVKEGLAADDWVVVKADEKMKAGMTVASVRVAMRESPAAEKGSQPGSASKDAMSGKLKELLRERHALLRKAADLLKQQVQAGRADLKSLRLAEQAAFEAGLETCENSAQRTEMIRTELKTAEDWLKRIETLVNNGQAAQSDALRAHAAVLELRIRLLREEQEKQQEKTNW